MVTQDQIKKLVKEIADGYKPEKIYLFGSYANGVPNNDSDIDLFIVKETKTRKIYRIEEVLNSLDINEFPLIGIDFIIYTPKELETAMTYFHNIGKIAVKTGRLVFQKD